MHTAPLLSRLGCAAVLLTAVPLSAQSDAHTILPTSSPGDVEVYQARSAGQDTTRKTPPKPKTMRRATSQIRLKVQKEEARGILEQTRADSIEAARRAWRDSVSMATLRYRDSVAAVEAARADSLAAVERARADSVARAEAAWRDSLARADSIAAAEQAYQRYMARYRFGGRGWYMGIAGGGTAPVDELDNLGYLGGFDANVPIGWHRENSTLGFRLDLGYNQFNGRSFTGVAPAGTLVTLQNANPQVLSAALNVTLAIPFDLIRNVSPYLVGGGGFYHFRSFGSGSALAGFLGNDVLATNAADNFTTRNTGGIQGGVGIDWTVGTSAIYLESRFVNVFVDRTDSQQFQTIFGTNRSNNLQWVPIVLGVKLR
jgi:hypothetical protein